jgi:hypothetical protein
MYLIQTRLVVVRVRRRLQKVQRGVHLEPSTMDIVGITKLRGSVSRGATFRVEIFIHMDPNRCTCQDVQAVKTQTVTWI